MNFGSLSCVLQVSLKVTSVTTYVSYKTLVRWRFGCALRGGTRGFWFIDPLVLRPRGLCTVATRARHVNHAPPSYNYNLCMCSHHLETIAIMGTAQIHISEISNYVLRINYTHTHTRTHAHFLCSLAGNSAMHSYKGCK